MTDAIHDASAVKTTVMMQLSRARMRLMTVWLIFAALIFLLVIAQSVAHKYEIPAVAGNQVTTADASGASAPDPSNTPGLDRSADVWKWLLPNLMPTLTAMVSAVAATWSLQQDNLCVRRDFFRFAYWLSFFYLSILLALILCQPFVNPFNMNAQVKSLQNSNLGMGPIQGLVAAAVGVLFASGKDSSAGTGNGKGDETPDKPEEPAEQAAT